MSLQNKNDTKSLPVPVPNNPWFDMGKIDIWDRLIFRLQAKELIALRVKVFDVDRPDIWDTLKGSIGDIVGAVFGKAKELVPGGAYSNAILGDIADELQSSIAKMLAKGDKVLFKGTITEFGSESSVTNQGSRGEYAIGIKTTKS